MTDRRFSRRTMGKLAIASGAAFAAGDAGRTSAQDSGAAWRSIPSADPIPSSRYDHTLVAHDVGKKLILFGGRDSGGVALGDTWLFSRTDERWTLLDSPGPSSRFGHAVSTDQERERLYLFGGQAGGEFYNDLWEFDMAGGAWTQIADGSGAAASPRYGTSMVLTGEGTLVVSHGFTFEGRFDDTWSYDLDAGGWADISPEPDLTRPLKRCLHEAVWAEHADRMLLFGGCSSGFGPCPQGDLWSFEPPTRIWAERPGAGAPSARSNPALVHDGGRQRALLVGGLTDGGYAADVWSLSIPDADDEEPTWSSIELAGPSPRASHDAAITGPWLYLYGGIGDAGVLNDLWVLDAREIDAN